MLSKHFPNTIVYLTDEATDALPWKALLGIYKYLYSFDLAIVPCNYLNVYSHIPDGYKRIDLKDKVYIVRLTRRNKQKTILITLLEGVFTMEIVEGEYTFTDNTTRIKLDEVFNLLRQSHWAKNRPLETIAKTIETSLCFAIYHNDIQIGFARVVSDYAVYSLILDVIIDEEYRGNGLGKKLIEFINNHPSIKDTNKVLWTKYAEKLYLKCGFKEEDCYKFMFNRP